MNAPVEPAPILLPSFVRVVTTVSCAMPIVAGIHTKFASDYMGLIVGVSSVCLGLGVLGAFLLAPSENKWSCIFLIILSSVGVVLLTPSIQT